MSHTQTPSSPMPPTFEMVGSLMYMARLDAAGTPPLLSIGFRITDYGQDKWTQRFNQFKVGAEAAVVAGVRTLSAALRGTKGQPGITFPGISRVIVVGAISSQDGALREGCPVWRLGEGVANAKKWEWRPDLLQKTPHRSLHSIYNAADRDAEVAGRYKSSSAGGRPGIFLIADDFCTRGTTAADISRALIAANPGWQPYGVALAKTERTAFWGTGLNNDHIPNHLDQIWQRP